MTLAKNAPHARASCLGQAPNAAAAAAIRRGNEERVFIKAREAITVPEPAPSASVVDV